MSDPIWLPDVLRAAGLKCEIYPGAFERGHGDCGPIWGVMCHHTGSFGETPRGIAQHPSLGLAAQLHLSPHGVYTLCGVGIAYHAGVGSYPGLPTNNANPFTIAIEAAHDGRAPWPAVQYEAYVRGCAAIANHLRVGSDRVIGHKDWAGKSQGKWDPGGIDMPTFRSQITTTQRALVAPPAPTPPKDAPMSAAEVADLKKYFADYLTGYVGPGLSDVKDVRGQLTGSRDLVVRDGKVDVPASFPGWDMLGGCTVVEALALIGWTLQIPGFINPASGDMRTLPATTR